MNSRLSFYFMVVLLALGGMLVAILRHLETGVPFFPGEETEIWLVEARIDFRGSRSPVAASLALPAIFTPGFELIEENAASPGYGFSIVNEDDDRRAEWTRRDVEGEQSLYYKAQFVASDVESSEQPPSRRPSRTIAWDDAQKLAARQVLDRAGETSSSPESLTREVIKQLNNPETAQAVALLRADGLGRAEVLEALLYRAGIEVRLSMGLQLQDARRRQRLTPLVEVYTGGRWLVFNPRTGETGVPDDLLLWRRGGVSVLDVTGGRQSSVSFSMIRQAVSARQLALSRDEDSLFSRLGVHHLPIEEQSMFKLLLLLPLGAAVVVFMRVIVGMQTAGTFMPVLIALAFLQTSLVPGLVSFVAVIAIGLVLRGYLSRLDLLLVARIATLIVLVIFVISVLSIIGYQMGYSTGMTITFFPMIIMAWTIERMSILWEEEGSHEVLLQGGGSLLVAVLAYLLMQMPLLSHLSFNFPELNLVLLAAILGMGQYTGYKLSELYRFRAMDDL